MTIVAGFNSGFFLTMVADSRLTGFTQDGKPRTYRDVCQKIFPIGDYALMGFAGFEEPSGLAMSAVYDRNSREGLSWLLDESSARQTLEDALRPCPLVIEGRPICQIMIGFVDPAGLVIENRARPGTVLIALACRPFSYRKIMFSFELLGSGAIIRDDIEKTRAYMDVFNFGDASTELGIRHKTIWTMHVVGGLVERHGIRTVGGLYQPAYLTPKGWSGVPYRMWVELGKGLGTFVNMKIEQGRWVQEYEPTGKRVVIGTPFEDDFTFRDLNLNKIFDPRVDLSPDGPGIEKETSPQLVYELLGFDSEA